MSAALPLELLPEEVIEYATVALLASSEEWPPRTFPDVWTIRQAALRILDDAEDDDPESSRLAALAAACKQISRSCERDQARLPCLARILTRSRTR